jgi:hypothetical protein
MPERIAISPAARPFLKTLRRIPEDVRLSMATRHFDMWHPSACVCGWAIRDALAAAGEKLPVKNASLALPSDEMCHLRFGGGRMEWDSIFCGVVDRDRLPLIEEAFTVAVMEAIENRELV